MFAKDTISHGQTSEVISFYSPNWTSRECQPTDDDNSRLGLLKPPKRLP
jgi:hypothetical protein